MRRLVLLTASAVIAITAAAYAAVTNTVTYSAKVTYKGTPTAKKPANMAYQGVLHVDTDPPGSQPETAPTTAIYFAKGIKNNAKSFPFCNQSEIDGQAALPAKCKKAIVGTGTAKALAGPPGQPASAAIREDLTVTAVNGAKGSAIYLVLKSTPTAPVLITNRVVPGYIKKASGAFGTLVRFEVPPDLQNAGVPVALTDFNVKISGTPRKVKVGKVFKKLSYLQLTSCKSSLPVKAIVDFSHTADGGQTSTVPTTHTSSSKC
ncbi:MAG TPA: hypothetical protein VE570_09440 [Thermoleophilaceae bacterium]|nr:hypothetical protein [Thermoleophilaceae bacterium]